MFITSRKILFLALFAGSISALGQIAPAPEHPAAHESADPAGRAYPRSAVMNFVFMANTRNYQGAQLYLELSPENQAQGPEIARQLSAILDHFYTGDIRSLSTDPEGNLQDGLPPDVERLGTLTVNGQNFNVDLRRVEDAQHGLIWKFSAGTLGEVPEVYASLGRQFRDWIPPWLKDDDIFSLEIWQWLALLVLIPAAIAIGGMVSRGIALAIASAMKSANHETSLKNIRSIVRPLTLLAIIPVFNYVIVRLGFPLLNRTLILRIEGIVLIGAFAWLLARTIDLIAAFLKRKFTKAGQATAVSVLQLADRIAVILIAIAALLAAISHLGFSVSGLLAGVGIGGLAIAFAAQKSIESFFGGVTVIAGGILKVGDLCKLGNNQGIVEEVGIRSTKIRTNYGTLVTIPNALFATMEVENFGDRNRFLFKHLVQLRYETTQQQLQNTIEELGKMLSLCPLVPRESWRVSFIALSPSSLDIEVFAQIQTLDQPEFFRTQQELLLQTVGIVNNSSAGFAFPSQTIYLTEGQSKVAAPPA